MNNKYAYSNDGIVVHTDIDLVYREYVDNIDDILKVENNIEMLKNEINILSYNLGIKKHMKDKIKLLFNIISIMALIGSVAIVGFGIGAGFVLPALQIMGIYVGVCYVVGLFASSPAYFVEDIRKKTIKKIENKISVFKHELEEEKKQFTYLKSKSKKIEIPNCREIKQIPIDYNISNLKIKLSIVEKFKEAPNWLIDEYNNGTIEDVLVYLGCTNMDEGIQLVKYLIDEYQKEQVKKVIAKDKTKSKNKR